MDKRSKINRRKSNAYALVILVMLSTIISVVPITESKASEEVVSGNYCGADWTLDDEGTLTLSGTAGTSVTGVKWDEGVVNKIAGSITIQGDGINSNTVAKWFNNLPNLYEIACDININNTNNSAVQIEDMFKGCDKLTVISGNINIHSANGEYYASASGDYSKRMAQTTGGSVNVNNLFQNCQSLEAITGNITIQAGNGGDGSWYSTGHDNPGGYGGSLEASHLFSGCNNLKTVTGNIKLIAGHGGTPDGSGQQRGNAYSGGNATALELFKDCYSLETIGAITITAGNCANGYWVASAGDVMIDRMFENCTNLSSVRGAITITAGDPGTPVYQYYNPNKTAGYIYADSIFSNCVNLNSIASISFNRSKNLNNLFNSCRKLSVLNLSKLDTVNATTTGLLNDCRSLNLLRTPEEINSALPIQLPHPMYDSDELEYWTVSEADVLLRGITSNNQFDVTLNRDGGYAGSTLVTAVYCRYLPDISIPKKDGYIFNGYYDAGGIKYYDEDGECVHRWDYRTNGELIAQWIYDAVSIEEPINNNGPDDTANGGTNQTNDTTTSLSHSNATGGGSSSVRRKVNVDELIDSSTESHSDDKSENSGGSTVNDDIDSVNDIIYEEVIIYRLYNPNTGEHFYTDSLTEKNYLVSIGWNYEGISFIASDSGEAVYRLFNPYSSEHHYTLDENEKNVLCTIGWNDEGIGWYSNETDDVCEKKLYRLFNPNAYTMTHHYTIDENERNSLVKRGWIDEGTCWNSVHGIIYHEAVKDTISSDGYNTCAICGEVFDYGNDWKEPFYQHYHDMHGLSYTGAEVMYALEHQYDWIECDYDEYMDATVSKCDENGYYIGVDNHKYDVIIDSAYKCGFNYNYVGSHGVLVTVVPAYYQCNTCGKCTKNDGISWDYVPPHYC